METTRRDLIKFIGGAGAVARLVLFLFENEEQQDAGATIFYADALNGQETLEFTLNPGERVFLTFPYDQNLRVSYILNTANDRPLNTRLVEYEPPLGGGETDLIAFVNTVKKRISSLNASHPVPAASTNCALVFEHPGKDIRTKLSDSAVSVTLTYTLDQI